MGFLQSSVRERADGKHQGSEDGTACYRLPGFFQSTRWERSSACSQLGEPGETLHCRHLQASVRELIREAARERGVCAQGCLLPNTATPCHHLPAAKVCGNGRSGQRMVRRSGAEREGDGAISQVISHTPPAAPLPGGRPPAAPVPAVLALWQQGSMQRWLGPGPGLSSDCVRRAKLVRQPSGTGASGARQIKASEKQMAMQNSETL